MARVKDAELIAVGRVLGVDPQFLREDRKRNNEIVGRAGDSDGRKVTLLTSGSGFSIVKVAAEFDDFAVTEMSLVVWYVTPSEYSVGDNSGMTTKFLRVATVEDVRGVLGAAEAYAKEFAKAGAPA
jgi:hypothetical protein